MLMMPTGARKRDSVASRGVLVGPSRVEQATATIEI